MISYYLHDQEYYCLVKAFNVGLRVDSENEWGNKLIYYITITQTP